MGKRIPYIEGNQVGFERFVSRRYLHPKGRTVAVSVISWISLLGVTIGVMVLIVVISVMNGFQADLIKKVIGAYSHVVLDTADYTGDFEPAYQVLKGIDNVEAAAPVVLGYTMIRATNYAPAQVKGVEPRFESKVTDLEANLVCGSAERLSEENLRHLEGTVEGATEARGIENGHGRDARGTGRIENVEDLFNDRRLPGIILGKELAKKIFQERLPGSEIWTRETERRELARLLGATVTVISIYEEESPLGGKRPRERRFEVVGITDSGLFDFDDVSAFVSLDAARYLYNLREGYRRIEIKVKDPYRADKTLKEAKRLLYQELGLSFGGMTWKEFNRPLFTAIQIEKLVMFVILVLLILLAGFSVAATLILTVLEKTREIGVLRAVGATRRSVRNIFLRIGFVVGAIGSLFGSILGGAVCMLLKIYPISLPGGGGVYYIDKMPVETRLFDFALVVSVTLVICVLAAAYPARIAAKLVPVEALRYE